MKTINGINFADSIGVLYDLKELHGHKTLQETYGQLQKTDVDSVFEILLTSYNRAHAQKISLSEFLMILEEKSVGFMSAVDICKQLIESIMFSGMSAEQVEQQKNLMKKLSK